MSQLDEKLRAARLSVVMTTLLTLSKVAIGIGIHSISVFSEGIHSGVDMLAAIIAYASVRESSRPPDVVHPFGHGKFESLSGAIEALLILVAAAYVVYSAFQRLAIGAHVDSPGWGALIMAADAAVNFHVSMILFRVSRKTESIALEADGWHLRTHVYTSLGVSAGLFIITATDRHEWDPLAAISVALIITRAGWLILRDAWRHLADATLPANEVRIIDDIMSTHEGEIQSFHKLRTRRSGPYRQIDFHLVVAKAMSVESAHLLCDHLESHIKANLPRTEVVIHVEPERIEQQEVDEQQGAIL